MSARHHHGMAPAEEFLILMDMRRSVERRLDELTDIIDPDGTMRRSVSLEKSGLRQVKPGVMLFRGGRLNG